MVNDLRGLELQLADLSHCEDAIKLIQTYCAGLKNTQARMQVWNSANAIVQKPIDRESIRTMGFDTSDDDFLLLQGDIIRTDSAFSFGERATGYPKYAVLNSSCDLVPGRSSSAMLLRIVDIKRSEVHANDKLSQYRSLN